MDTSVSELANAMVNQLMEVKVLYQTFYQAQQMKQDTTEVEMLIEIELEALKHIVMIWAYASGQGPLKKVEDV